MKQDTNVMFNGGGGTHLSAPDRFFKAFTLAEMMVVMLILSIVMAAFAPVMTTRSKTDRNSPWRYASDNSNIYYGLGENQTAMIGQPSKNINLDPSSRLIISTSDGEQKHIVFKRGQDNLLGSLFFTNSNSLGLGNGSNKGDKNISFGIGALKNNGNSASYNTAVGYNSLNSNTSGSNNTAVGSSALSANSTADYNTAVGVSAMLNNSSGMRNTAVGYNSLYNNEGANYNTALGNNSMYYNTSGSENTAAGSGAMYNNTTGSENVAFGATALYYNTEGYGNTAIGNGTLYYNKQGHNTGTGYRVLFANKTGQENTASGFFAMTGNDSGSYNTAYGSQAFSQGKSGSNNVANGYQAMRLNEAGYNNVALGYRAMYNSKSSYNVAVGSSSMYNLTSGESNVAVGSSSLNNLKTGQSNVAIGQSSAYVLSSGSENIAIGGEYSYNGTASGTRYGTLGSNYTGNHNIAVGAGALPRATGSNNIAIGTLACENISSASNKTCIGNHSGPTSYDQMTDSSTESYYIGSPGRFVSGNTNIDTNSIFELHKKGDYAVAFLNADLVVNGFTWTQVGGKSGHGDAIGFFRSKTWKNQVELYNETRPGFPPASPFSDRRLKYVGQEFTSGLDKIKQLRVFNYTFKDDEKKTPHIGVIAQDLQKIFPEAVFKDEETGFLKIRTEDMFYALINAVKEVDEKICSLASDIKSQAQTIKQLRGENKLLKERVNNLEKRLDKLERQLK